MIRFFEILFIAFAALLFSCSGSTNTDSAEQETDEMELDEAGEEFVPTPDMPLQSLAAIPGVGWDFEVIKGICAPDTLLLWLSYGGRDYMTNVHGIDDDFSLLTTNGIKKIKKSHIKPQFEKIDFLPYAVLTSSAFESRDEFRVVNDSLYRQRLDILAALVKDFFISGGSLEYMSDRMAANWAAIYAQNEIEGSAPLNPFNGGPIIEIDSEMMTVDVTDARNGIVEVSAYCYDPFTLGEPGRAYWTVFICRQKGEFKIKETPAQHRKFTTG